MRRLTTATLILLCAAPTTSSAVEVADGVKLGAHLRSRFVRHDGRDGSSDNDPIEYFENRIRLSADIDAVKWVRAFVQLQDVRAWGEETNTLTDFGAQGFDVHQGYADLRLGGPEMVLRVGRQEIVHDDERLIGAVGWTAQARSFDALRFWWEGMDGKLHLEAFYSQLLDRDAIEPGGANANTDTAYLAGLGGTYAYGHGDSNLNASLWAYLDHSDTADRTRATVGLRHAGAFGMVRYRVEGYYQLGDIGDDSISAFMAGLDLGVVVKSAAGLDVRLWADYLSGGSKDEAGAKVGDNTKTFDTLFATNHAYYGFADYFINIPAHTQGKGLIDLALKAAVSPLDNLTLKLDGHYFLPADDYDDAGAFGMEIDFMALWKPYQPVGVLLGVFTMLPDKGLEARIGGKDADLGVYAQLQFDL